MVGAIEVAHADLQLASQTDEYGRRPQVLPVRTFRKDHALRRRAYSAQGPSTLKRTGKTEQNKRKAKQSNVCSKQGSSYDDFGGASPAVEVCGAGTSGPISLSISYNRGTTRTRAEVPRIHATLEERFHAEAAARRAVCRRAETALAMSVSYTASRTSSAVSAMEESMLGGGGDGDLGRAGAEGAGVDDGRLGILRVLLGWVGKKGDGGARGDLWRWDRSVRPGAVGRPGGVGRWCRVHVSGEGIGAYTWTAFEVAKRQVRG